MNVLDNLIWCLYICLCSNSFWLDVKGRGGRGRQEEESGKERGGAYYFSLRS